MKKLSFIAVFLLLNTFNLNAQNGFENFFLAENKDSNLLMNAYFSPKINGYNSALNSNWYHTAKSHKPFGFDLTVNFNSVIYPSNKESFNLENLVSVNLPTGNITGASAIGASTSNSTTINRQINTEESTAVLNLPAGESTQLFTNSNLPIIQLTVGISANFDVILRALPTVKPNNQNEAINVLGFGIKKEISNLFPSLKDKPIHLSLLAGYSVMNVSYGITDSTLPEGNFSGISVNNGLTTFNSKAFTFQALASYHWTHVNLFGGIAYNTAKTTYQTNGTFLGKYITDNSTINQPLDTSNALNINSNGISANLGARLNLRYFKIFTSYTLQEFSVFNIGAAISIK
ncbi:DUF6588 family protein [uncultured Polaribacter sp.]|uniref:DUF6588 family protein n=1 Tax=uncultured Polaribacter sp. TaxID=174711 RepID=UPI002613758F|nr:DUF6588 family protein [uncultured Polaribacter sp.]